MKVGTSVLAKYPARERTREPLKYQLKGGGVQKKAERKEVEKEEEENEEKK